MMKPKAKNIFLWGLAAVITVSLARYQRTTGPTYPLSGKSWLGSQVIKYRLDRSHEGIGDQEVRIKVPDETITGLIIWKRYRLDEPVKVLDLRRQEGWLVGYLPHQPPSGKLEYRVVLRRGSEQIQLPPTQPAITRFKGRVPRYYLHPHILFMFASLLTAMRAALGAVFTQRVKPLAWVTMALVIIGGLVFGPIVQKYAFGAYWTGWPFGGDWTDNKTAVMVLAWGVALWKLRGKEGEKRGRWWTVAAMVVMFAMYLIPHSIRGSELDYNKIEQR
ncbi:MAG: hypothetical protein V2A61_04600 [Calditrichota bacterium]